MFLTKVCRCLSEAGVDYAIVGGFAVSLHGATRGTVDIDVVVRWQLESLQRTERALKELGLESRIPVRAEDIFHFREEYMAQRNLIAWNFFDPRNPLDQVDLIIALDLADFRTKQITVNRQKVILLAIDDLIDVKRKSGRPQDLEDVKALEHLRDS